MAALYLHIPFCRSKCHYCSFSSCVWEKDLSDPYVEALLLELSSLAEIQAAALKFSPLSTLFIGGGTPTCLPAPLLQKLVMSSFDLFGKVEGVEVSIEANPGTVDSRYLEALLEAGVNRLSFGIQSFIDQELRTIGRIHDRDEACLVIQAAREAGFENINLDLMYGLPGQTPDSWKKSLEKALSFLPEHLSLYQLTIEPGTPFESLVATKTLTLPTEEEVLIMDAITKECCTAAGLFQYEISNYANRGKECRHNINYWLNNDYFGVGASAVSCLDGARERRIGDPHEYIRRMAEKDSVIIEKETLSTEESFRETVIMGLRMVQGVSRKTLTERYQLNLEEYYGSTLQNLKDQGFVELTDSHLRISEKGWPLSNTIMAELV